MLVAYAPLGNTMRVIETTCHGTGWGIYAARDGPEHAGRVTPYVTLVQGHGWLPLPRCSESN